MKKFIICLSALLFVGCAKDSQGSQDNQINQDNQVNQGNNPITNENPPVVQTQDVFPKQVVVEHDDETINERVYDVKNDKVASITYKTYRKDKKDDLQHEYQEVFTYKNNLPKSSLTTDLKTSKLTNKKTYSFQDGKLTEKVEETYGNNSTNVYTISYKYDGEKLSQTQEKYNDGVSVQSIYKYLSSTEILIEQSVTANQNGEEKSEKNTIRYTLDDQQRIVKIVSDNSDYETTQEYQYDDKNNYKYNTIDLMKNPDYFIKPVFMKNNLVRSTYVSKKKNTTGETTTYTNTYQYQYNDKGYPISITEEDKRNDDVDTKTITIMY